MPVYAPAMAATFDLIGAVGPENEALVAVVIEHLDGGLRIDGSR